MKTPNTEVYEVRSLSDELGDGYRLYSSQGNVYEARTLDRAETRTFSGEDGWKTMVRVPVNDETEAYEWFKEFTTTIKAEYDIDLSKSSMDFHNQVDRKSQYRRVNVGSGDTHVLYNIEGDITIPSGRAEKAGAVVGTLTDMGGSLAGGMGGGAVIGGAIGSLAGPAGTAAGISAGGTVGAIAGGLRVGDLVFGAMDGFYILPTYGKDAGENAVKRIKARKYLKDGMTRGRKKLIDRYNEKNLLEQEMEQNDHLEHVKRFDKLKDKGVQQTFDLFMNAQFDEHLSRQGIIAERRGVSYDEAITFIGHLLDESPASAEEPSLYTDVDVFRSVFERFDEHDLGADQDVLAWNALDAGNDEILDYLEDEHAEILDDVGFEYGLEGDA